MMNAPDRAFIVYLVTITKDKSFKKLMSKMSDNRVYSFLLKKDEFERIGGASKEFESRILNKILSDQKFAEYFKDRVATMSVMTSEHANLKNMVNNLHAAAVSHLAANAAQSALDEILGEI